MRSMQWQIGILGTFSAFAYRHREIMDDEGLGSVNMRIYVS
jgi:hypothetical protein